MWQTNSINLVSDCHIIIRARGELKDDDQKRWEVFEKIKGVYFTEKILRMKN